MDANNRQNQSTQTRALQNGGSPQQATLEQNTAFGTAKNPEGFAATWKNATHLWRWRAVLCVFLSLLLTMMQPAGNALYRSWNADTGDMMGLAVALTGTDLTTGGSSDITGGDEADAPDETVLETTDDDDYTPVSHTAADGRTYYTTKKGRVVYHATHNEAAEFTWAANEKNVTPSSGAGWVAYWPVVRSNGWVLNGVTTDELPDDDDPRPGNIGAITWINGMESVEGHTEPYAGYMTTYGGNYIWALGYELAGWIAYNPQSEYVEKDSNKCFVNTGSADNPDQGAPYGDYYIEGIAVFPQKVRAGDSYVDVQNGSAPEFNPAVDKNDSSKGYYDWNFYAAWSKRNKYKLFVGIYDSDYEQYTSILLDQSSTPLVSKGIAWDADSLFNELDPTYKDLVEGDRDVRWTVHPVAGTSTIQSAAILENVRLDAETSVFGDVVNPGGLGTSPDIDPFSKSSGYAKNNGNLGSVGITPSFVIEYNANGGTGSDVSSFDAYMEDDSFEGELDENPKVKTLAQTGIEYTGATFKGWAINDPDATTPDILPSDCGKYFSEYQSLKDMYYQWESGYYITDSVTFYAVWDKPVEKLKHTVNYTLSNTESNTLQLSRNSDILEGGNKISSLQYDDSTPPQYIGPTLQNSNGTAYDGPKYSGEFEWSTSASIGIDTSAAPEEGTAQTYAVTLTPKVATYAVNVQANHGSLGTGATDATEILEVPYGTAYKDIKYKAGDSDLEQDPTKFYYSTASDALPITTAADHGQGSRGKFADASGGTTWTGVWSDSVVTRPSTTASSNIGGSGVASLDNTAATVTGPTTLTFDYDKGYNKITFAVASAASNATTGMAADKKTAIESQQSTSDLELSFYEAYVHYDNWTAAGVANSDNWASGTTTGLKYPTASLQGSPGYSISDKYEAITTDTHNNGTSPYYVAWSGFPTATGTLPNTDGTDANKVELIATPTLKTYSITVTVNGSPGSGVTNNGAYITKKADGSSPGEKQTSAVVGQAKWGEYADTAITPTVIGGIEPTNSAGYTTTGATWSPGDPAATQVTNAVTTFTIALATKTFDVQVNVNGGKINGEGTRDATTGITTGTFYVYDVPYNTKVEDIRYDKSETKTIDGKTAYQFTNDAASGDVVALDVQNGAKTELDTGRNPSGEWTSALFDKGYATLVAAKTTESQEDPAILPSVTYNPATDGPAATLTYEFGRDDVTVNFVINGDGTGGTWAGTNPASGTITGTVPYGKTLDDAVASDGTTKLSIPNPNNITVTDTNQYENDSSSGWSGTTPTFATVVAPTTGSSGSWSVTYSYMLTTRTDLSVTYNLPQTVIDANEVEFDGAASFTNLTYNTVRANVAQEPTAIKAKSGVDATMVAKKYNLTGFTWTPGLATNVTSNQTYTANITLRDYSVEYSIANGSWGTGVNSTDGSTYNYGNTPNTSYTPSGGSATAIPMANLSASGTNTSATDTVVPSAGYKKTGGAWEGVWEMRVSNDNKSTWSSWGPLTKINGETASTPSEVDITGDTQFRLTLKRVVSVAFQSDGTSIKSNGPAQAATEYFAGDPLSAPAVSDSIQANDGYQKSNGAKSGHWYKYGTSPKEEGVPTTVPDSATALVYEYALYAVHTATYHIEHGNWTSTSGYIDGGDGTLKEEVFANVGITPPASTSANSSVYNLALEWYAGASKESGTSLGAGNAPTGQILTDVDYTAYYGSSNTYTYKVEFYVQNTSKTGFEATPYHTYTATKTGGDVVKTADSIIDDNTPQKHISNTPDGAFTISAVDTANHINTDLNKQETVEGNITHKIYYDRNVFSYTYAYEYDDYSKFTGLEAVTDLPNPAITTNVPYGSEVALDTAAQTNTYYTFSGWQPSYTTTPSGGSPTTTNVTVSGGKFTMPAADVDIKGTWTRKNVTITLKNNETTKGNITVSNSPNNNVTISTYKYGDDLDWSAYNVVPASNQYFSGWLDTNNGNNNIGQTLPARALAMNMDYVVKWSDKVTVSYVPDTKYNDSPIATFTEQNSGEMNPGSAIPAFNTTTYDPATAHKAGYNFLGWEWVESGTQQALVADNSSYKTQPKFGNTSVSLEFKPLYEGTTHNVTYSLNGGTQTTSNTAKMTEGTTAYKTGDKVWLPSTTELTRQGCTLRGFSIQVGSAEAQERPATTTGELYMIPAGTASSYTDAITITAEYDTDVTFSYEAPSTLTLSSDITNAITNASGTKGLGTTVDLPSVAEGGSTVSVSQAAIATGYHFAGWETNYNPLAIADAATDFVVPGDMSDTIPVGGLTVKAKWAIDQYKVSWAYESDSRDYDFTFPDDSSFDFTNGTSTVDYNTAGTSVTTPILKGSGAAQLDTAKYTAANVDWMLKLADGRVTKVNIKDITFGTPFYIASDGTLSRDPTDTQITWTNGTALTFVGIPVINEYDITVAVTNGRMKTGFDNVSSAIAGTSVTYHQKYGTYYSAFLPAAITGYEFTADASHDQNSGRWISTVTDPYTSGLFVQSDASYTYDFPTVKTYTVVYQLDSNYTDDAGKIELTSTGTTATWGTTYTTTSFPTLQVKSDAADPLDSTKFNSKYYPDLTWVRATSPVTPIVTGTSYTYDDDAVTTDSSTDGHNIYPTDKIITFIGTPKTKSYAISVNVSGGSFKREVTGVGADGKKQITPNAVYDKPLGDYLTSAVEGYFEQDANHMSTGHWEYGGTRVDLTNDKVQYTSATYTYVFDTKRTVTLQVSNGQFKNNVASTRTYYVPDDGTAASTLANAANPATGDKVFAGDTPAEREAGAKQVLLLEPQLAESGYEWNTTGWTSTAANTLVAEKHDPDSMDTTTTDSFNYPDVTAQISSDVTFTYAFAAKPVTVKFTQMFQKATPVDDDAAAGTFKATDYETLKVTEGGNEVDRYVNWTGTYSTTPVTVTDWGGRILSDATLKGYKVTPTKVTTDAAGTEVITEFSREHFSTTEEYYLWYERIPVTYSYAYTNQADAPTSAQSVPTGATVRWGQTAKLANPLDSTFAKALDGWYTAYDSSTDTLSSKAAALNADYTFAPAYTGAPTSLAMTLSGKWGPASYKVKFLNAKSGDPNDNNATFTLAGFTPDATDGSITTNPILYGNTLGLNHPTVTVSFADKYSHVGWRLYIGNSTSYETTVEGVTVDADGIIADADLSNVVVKRSDYVFKPVFKLNKITIKLEGGGHQDLPEITLPATQTTDADKVWTVQEVDYGTKVYLPTAAEWQAYRTSTAGGETSAKSWIDTNAIILAVDADKYAVKAKDNKNAGEPAAWANQNGTAWPSITENDHYCLEATANLTYQYQWEDIKYEVVYHTQDGETSDIHSLDGKTTTKTLVWGDSVFDAKLSDDAGSEGKTVRAKIDDLTNATNRVLYPEWAGHEFLGWQTGSSEAAERGTFTRGQDITISEAYRHSLVAANEYKVHLWALWSGEKKTVTFYKNDGSATDVTATQAIEIDMPTNLTPIADWRSFDREGFTFLGWSTTPTGNVEYNDNASYTVAANANPDTLKLYAQWRPSKYKVQFAYFDGTPMTVEDVTGAAGNKNVFEQEIEYGKTANLQSVVIENVNAATHNPDGDVFAGWSYRTDVYQNGDPVSNLSSEDGGVVLLTPVKAGKVNLQFEANAGTDTVTGMPAPNPAVGSVITTAGAQMEGYAPFELAAAPERAGYNFAGWQVYGAKDANGDAISGPVAAGATIYLDGKSAFYIAYAQWTAGEKTAYTIERQRQKAVGSSEYEVFHTIEGYKAPTGTYVEIGVGDLAAFQTAVAGYKYMPGLSTTRVQVTADGAAKLVLKYNIDSRSVTYAFTEGGLPLAGDAAGLTPYGDDSKVELTPATAVTTLKLPGAAVLPDGYQIASGHAANTWVYAPATNTLQDAPDSGDPVAITATTVLGDGATKYTVVGDAVLTLPIEKKKFTVTFAHDANTTWTDGDTNATKTVSNVTYGDMVDPDGSYPASTSVGASVQPAAAEGYGWGGWVYNNATDNADPLNGTVVDPATTAIKGDVTFTATHYQSYTVTWSAGGFSASGFSHTREADRLFKQLPATGYRWESDGSETRTAGIKLDPADEFAVGEPLAKNGYQFAGWKASCDDSIMEVDSTGADTTTKVNGKTYQTLEELYAAVPPSHDYTFTAQWDKLVQTVLFNPNTAGGAAAGQLISAIQGYSGEDKDLDGHDAMTPAAPQARPGYAFDYWRGIIGGKLVKLSAEQAFTFPMNQLGVTDMYTAVWKEAIIDIVPEIGTYDVAGTTFTAGNGTVEQNQATTQVRALDTTATYTLQARPDPGYKFARWEVSVDGGATWATSLDGTSISGWYDGTITDKSNGAYGLITLEPVGGAYQEAIYRAVLEPDPYQVSFENSATPGEGSVSVTYDTVYNYTLVERDQFVDTTEVTVSATPSAGYAFLGWTYEVWPETVDATTGALVTATEPVAVSTPIRTEDLGKVAITGRTVFTAKYAAQPASLTYDKNADAATGSIGAVTGKLTGDPVTLPADPGSGLTWAGHTLLGWATLDGAGSKPPASMTADEFDAYAYKAGRAGDTYTLKGGAETLYAVYLAEKGTLVYDNNATDLEGYAKHASNGILVNANEDGVALSVAAVGWTGGALATSPGYETPDASKVKVPGDAREFVGWSTDPNVDPDNPGSTPIWKPGDTIDVAYMPASSAAADAKTIYAIWKDKTFTVTLSANGGTLKSGAVAPNVPLASGVRYGERVQIPALMYERTNGTFRYWLANDGDHTQVGDSSGAATTYKFAGTSDVTLSASWKMDSSVTYKVTMQLRDENGLPLTSANMGPYALDDTPLYGGAYENLSVTSTNPLQTANTGAYYDFEGWYIFNELKANQKVTQGASATVADIVHLYDGVRVQSSGFPTYWDGSAYTALFNNNTVEQNLLTLYAKKTLKSYDVSFDPNVPAGSGYRATDVKDVAGTLGASSKDTFMAEVRGETDTLAANGTYGLPGYRFLGWLTSQPTSTATISPDAFATKLSSGDAVSSAYSLSTPLLSSTSTKHAVTLYAAWADTDNTVTFVSAYNGDGVRAADSTAADTVHATQAHKTWVDTFDAVAALEKHPEDAEASFAGWYTVNNKKVELGASAGQCDTVADILAIDSALPVKADGSYDITLYAHYTYSSARVVYNGDTGAIAPATPPSTQTVTIDQASQSEPTGTITLHMASDYLYNKAGYHMDGWEGKGNTATYNGNGANYYNKVWLDTDTNRTLNFDKDSSGTTVNVYPHYAANTYTVNYDYAVPEGYKSYIMTAAVPGKDANGNVTQKTSLGWSTGSVYASNLFLVADPVLEGYELTGWTYTLPNSDKAITVKKGWTVENLVNAATLADPNNEALIDKRFKDSTFTLKAVWTPKTYTVAYNADGGVVLGTTSGPSPKTGIAWTASTDGAGDSLLIESSKLSKSGYSNPVWYVDAQKTVKANGAEGAGDNPTFADLAYLYHQAAGHAQNAGSEYAISDANPLTLYADWEEDTATVVFTVSNPAAAFITQVSENGTTKSFAGTSTSQVVYTVGVATGEVQGLSNVTIDQVSVTVGTAAGYSISGWKFDTATVGNAGQTTFSVPPATSYVGGTYVAQISGNGNADMTLRYFDMDNTGAYPTEPTATQTGLKAEDFLNAQGSHAGVGDIIPAANLGEKRADVPDGLSVDESKLADYEVKTSGNVVDVYYKRATVDVTFEWAWPDGNASATPPSLPAPYKSVYYGTTQATPASPTAPQGYTFDGWFRAGSSTALDGAGIAVDSLDGVKVVGRFSKASYPVTFTGVYDENGVAAGTKLTGDGVPTMSPASLAFATPVEYGQTLGNTIKIDLIDTATVNKVNDRTLGSPAGQTDLTVTYDSSRSDLSWAYTKDGGATWVSTSDPTSVTIEGATEFRLVASNAQAISYLAGDHGAFATKVSEGTRAESVAAGYAMKDYLYEMASADGKKAKAGPAGADGLPRGEDGWVFAGWKWEYALPQGYVQEGPTDEMPRYEDLTGLVHGIALTAQWQPGTSYLKLDLNDSAVVAFDGAVRASYVSGYTSPEGLQPTYDEALDNAVTLPDETKVTREGFTLEKWVWETSGGTYEYAPGAEFQMPGSSKKQSDDPAVTLKAVWAEDCVTIDYYSTDNAKGTVTVSSETIGAWTGNVRGSTATPAAKLGGSGVSPASAQYEFSKWTKDDPDGDALTEATGLRAGNSVDPQRVSKAGSAGRRYYDAEYYATFAGKTCYVYFGVDEGSLSPTAMGQITVNGIPKSQRVETRQVVPYGETPVMDGVDYVSGAQLVVKAVPASAEYETGDGRFWDYYINTGDSANPVWVKQYSVYDPSEVEVTANESLFLANFKKSTGKYEVRFDTRQGTGTFSPVHKAWGDANVGAGKTPRRSGYDFTGWYATPYGQVYASATDARPGMLEAVSNTYGQLVGNDAFAERAKTEGITLLAGWAEKSGYAVTVSANGGDFVDAAGQATGKTTSVAGLKWTSTLTNRLSTPKRAGYDFVGWSTQREGTAIASTTKYGDLAGDSDDAPGNVTLYAQWAEKTYLVRYMNYPRSNNDPITRAGEVSFTRELKYGDAVVAPEPYNAKSDDRAWNCWKVATGGSSTPNVSLTGTEANWTVAQLESNDVTTDPSDGAYIVYGTWTNYITWTTTYVLYEDAPYPYDENAIREGEGMGDDFDDSRHVSYLKVTDKALPGKDAVPNFTQIPPGFEFNHTAEGMTVEYNNVTNGTDYATTDDMSVPLTEGTTNLNFDVVVLAKTGYQLAFDMNDENSTFPGGTLKAVTGADAGNAATFATQTGKTFYSTENVPWDTAAGKAYEDPTRPGFSFDGWHNLVVKDNEDINAKYDIRANAEMYYGDLAYNNRGTWYDPMVTFGGVLTLHARWLELQRLVRYTVASDMTQLVRIRLQSEAADAFSTDERSQIIGAATGDLFVDGVRKTRAQVPSGAVAEANRGYQVQWRIVVDDADAQAKAYEMPFGTGMDASAMSAFEAAEAVMDAFVPASGGTVVADLSADMVTAASGAARSTEGVLYSATDAITPGVVADENAADYGLFAGNSMPGAEDATAHDVQYVATVVENTGATITINPEGGTCTGPTTVSQPYGTFIGESAPWGLADGKLPAANTISRWGYTFNGWVIPAGTKYVDSRGLTKTITSTTTLKPTDDIANRIIVPAGGITLKAAWTLNANATVKIDANGGKYPGTSSWTQPALTYIGEQEPWGSGLGALPSGDGATRWGYDFNGYIVPAGTQYTDGNATKTLDADTTVKPTDSLAKRLILPASGVTLKVAWKEKPAATVRVDANGGTYSGSASWAQPQSTYVGEKAPWGSGLGALPAANTVTRTNYRFDGWIVPAGTQYATASGAVQTLDKDTTVLPTSDMAKRIILPANGLTLKAAWTEAIIPFGDDLVISPLPDVDYTSYAVQNPAVKVTLGGKTLVAGTDYTTLYTNNVEVGTATVTVTGKGLYKGTKSATFRINHIAQKQGFVDLDRNGWYMTTDLTPGSNAGNFKGIETLYLDLVFARELMTGYRNPDGTYTRFGPDDKVTRAQAATILYRIANAGKTDTYNPSDYARSNTTGLPDVETGQYYTAAVNWAQREGVITGYGTPGHYYAFGPNDNVTREQMATMISRFCVQYYGKPNKASALSYKDGGSINSWARAGVQYCSAVGIMAGYGTSGIFGPQDNATRCQVGKIVAVAVHEVIDK